MLVSVIIPTHNRPKFTREAIASVKAQTYRDFELIIIDDVMGRGAAWARNRGAEKANGKYLAFLDSDDLWDKKKLKRQIEYLKKNRRFKACYTDEKWIRNGKHLNQMKKHRKFHGWIFDECLPLCIISASSILMTKELFNSLGGFDESLPVCEDYDLWLRLSLIHPIAFLDEKLITKRGGHPDQLSKKYWGMDRFRIKALGKLSAEKLNNDQRRLVLGELQKKYQILLSGFWKRKRYLQWLLYKYRSIIFLK
ncbi:MAG: glycosyltransferase [Candidatus Margulisiibacteriota bacterium]|nr:glycosyltransferase [Candidatus Margulisiibacteriota bacterium]